jgi:hypothetical protein
VGGYGSGVYGSRKRVPKGVVERSRSIDVRPIFGEERITPGEPYIVSWVNERTGEESSTVRILLIGESKLKISFSINGESIKQLIPIEWTSCNYGGSRAWFNCPSCRRRVAIVHMPLRKYRFLCRQCHDLTYRSCQLAGNPISMANHKLRKVCSKLGVTFNPQDTRFPPFKPQGMHQTTYDRLWFRYTTYMQEKLAGLIAGQSWK